MASQRRRKSADEVHRNMSAIRSRDNKTERDLARLLHSFGLRFRRQCRTLPGCPDLVFSGPRVAVFVDGDFWHARDALTYGLSAVVKRMPPHSREYWSQKFAYRIRRDQEVTAILKSSGWQVVRVWESDIQNHLIEAALRIALVVERRCARSTRGET